MAVCVCSACGGRLSRSLLDQGRWVHPECDPDSELWNGFIQKGR
jgi:hypothetical protein